MTTILAADLTASLSAFLAAELVELFSGVLSISEIVLFSILSSILISFLRWGIESRVQTLPGGERRWLHSLNESLGMVSLIVATGTVQLSVILVRSSQSSALSRLLSTLVALMLVSTLMNAGRLSAQRGPPPP